MALLQSRLAQGISLVYSVRVTKVERSDGRLRLRYQETGGPMEDRFDRVILAVNPKQISKVYSSTACIMDSLQTSDISVVIHQDYNMLPEGSTDLVARL
jgi:predicted NAD/FAD-binding protein